MAGEEINFSSLRIMSGTEGERGRRDKNGKREVDGERRVRMRGGGGGGGSLKVKRLCMSPCVILSKERGCKTRRSVGRRRRGGRTTALSRRPGLFLDGRPSR